MPVPISSAALLFNRQDELLAAAARGFFSVAAACIGAEGEDGGCGQGSQDPTRQEGAPQARAQDRKRPSMHLIPPMFSFVFPKPRCGSRKIYLCLPRAWRSMGFGVC